jgi:hypothetical protein
VKASTPFTEISLPFAPEDPVMPTLRHGFGALALVPMLACTTEVISAPDGGVDAGSGPTADGGQGCAPAFVELSLDPVLSTVVSTEPATQKGLWILRGRSGTTNVTVTVRESAGATSGAFSGELGDEQLNPGNAKVSVQAQEKCNAHGDHYHCGARFVAVSGSYAFTRLDPSAGGSFAMELSATLQEARIASGVATLVEGGQSMCVVKLPFSGKLSAP